MDKNPNCIIDQIYRKVDEPVCKNTLYTVKTIAWTELHKPNTWLFIANVHFRAAIICEGRRQEVTLNNTGILLVAPHCIIKTKYASIQGNRNVLSLWNPEPQKDAHQTSSNLDIDEEPVLNAPDTISRLDSDEEFTTYRWRRATIHSTTFIIIATIR
ncbi:hypothetical protein HHI36_004613 [Cryptolaemus montrouzieri]|uniref:Uncharacterized protein n=1 Tax=Cryptolaemus montrouzieri TaxID=559131 RepID=A0ABD2NS29_9CUCU